MQCHFIINLEFLHKYTYICILHAVLCTCKNFEKWLKILVLVPAKKTQRHLTINLERLRKYLRMHFVCICMHLYAVSMNFS